MVLKIDMQPITVEDLEQRLQWFEHRYNCPSSRLIDAFRVDGRLVETSDMDEWESLYSAWSAAVQTGNR